MLKNIFMAITGKPWISYERNEEYITISEKWGGLFNTTLNIGVYRAEDLTQIIAEKSRSGENFKKEARALFELSR